MPWAGSANITLMLSGSEAVIIQYVPSWSKDRENIGLQYLNGMIETIFLFMYRKLERFLF